MTLLPVKWFRSREMSIRSLNADEHISKTAEPFTDLNTPWCLSTDDVIAALIESVRGAGATVTTKFNLDTVTTLAGEDRGGTG